MLGISPKTMLHGAAGALGGSAAWAFVPALSVAAGGGLGAEILLGALTGMCIGGFVWSHEAMTGKLFRTAVSRAAFGAAAGILGGALGAGLGSTVFFISDHGFSSFRYGVDLNRWLEENGYLQVKSASDGKRDLSRVDWSQTRAFAIGLAGLYLNLRGREAQGVVDPKTEAPGICDEIAHKLQALQDPLRRQPAVKQVNNAREIYRGPYRDDAPDLIVGYHAGYRASWDTAVGKITDGVFHDDEKAWSGDHCIDHSLVPGVLFCNRDISDEHPALMDIGPTVLDMFGVKVAAHMDGNPLAVAHARVGAGHRKAGASRPNGGYVPVPGSGHWTWRTPAYPRPASLTAERLDHP